MNTIEGHLLQRELANFVATATGRAETFIRNSECHATAAQIIDSLIDPERNGDIYDNDAAEARLKGIDKPIDFESMIRIVTIRKLAGMFRGTGALS